MFNIFNSGKKFEPLNYEGRKYFEGNLLWLMEVFPERLIETGKILTPTPNDFPIKWNNSESNAVESLKIICSNMLLDFNSIEITFFENAPREIDLGSSVIFLEGETKGLG